MLTPDLLAYLIETPSLTHALKTLRYAEDTGYPTKRGALTALLTAQLAHERRNRIYRSEFDVKPIEVEPRVFAAV